MLSSFGKLPSCWGSVILLSRVRGSLSSRRTCLSCRGWLSVKQPSLLAEAIHHFYPLPTLGHKKWAMWENDSMHHQTLSPRKGQKNAWNNSNKPINFFLPVLQIRNCFCMCCKAVSNLERYRNLMDQLITSPLTHQNSGQNDTKLEACK